ncbi:MAG: hypothetical protein ACRDJF_02980, partial [Actinomycetota bacterium]
MRNARLLGADAQPERKGGPARLVWRARRHVAWVRAHGLGRVVEEDGLHPLQRAARALDRRRWRRANGVAPGAAVPVFLVGLQRSGTNMIVRGLERSPEFEVHNENDRRAFDRFRLRSDSTVRGLIASSRHRYVLLKPLCDSHQVPDLLELAGRPGTGRAIWAYRGVEGTARSALAKFGDLRGVLAEIAAGGGRERWHAQRLSEASLDLLTSFDYREMTPASSAALFWLIRNSLYFELGLERRGDVMAVSYESLLADPEST